MEEHRHLPDADRLSVLAAMVLLAYAMTPFIQLPTRSLTFQLPGFFFDVELGFNTVVSVLVAVLAASGADWLLHAHPHQDRRSGPHWLLPAMTAWVIGVPLANLQVGPQWWAVFAFGGLLFIGVMVSEYIALDPSDVRHGPASIGLTAVSFALLLVLAIASRAAGLRLFILLLTFGPAAFLVSLRSLHLRLGGWRVPWALAVALITTQIAAGLHYWPLPPLAYSLVLLSFSYGLTSFAGAVEEGRPLRRALIEPLVMAAALWLLAWITG